MWFTMPKTCWQAPPLQPRVWPGQLACSAKYEARGCYAHMALQCHAIAHGCHEQEDGSVAVVSQHHPVM
jgi:hypothetical protein